MLPLVHRKQNFKGGRHNFTATRNTPVPSSDQHKSKYNKQAVSRLNAKVEERGEEREEKRAVSLQPVWAQEPRKSVRETSGPCVNYKEPTTI